MTNTDPNNPAHVNQMDLPGTKSIDNLKAATRLSGGWVIREEPGTILAKDAVVVHACELMGRDIGRYVQFIERFGLENESARVIIAELRQIYMTGHGAETVALTVGLGGDNEYRLNGTDLVRLYGDGVEIDTILEPDRVIDNQGPKKKA